MTNRIRRILQQLETMREDLLSLSDDIWLSIDHNDTEAMREGVVFKEEYNEKMAAFDRLSGELSRLIQQFTQVEIEEPVPSVAERSTEATQRIVVDLNCYDPHSIEEDFTFKRPYGFRLADEAQSNITTWRRLYELVCLYLYRFNSDLFIQLPDNPDFLTRRSNPYFSRAPQDLRSAMPLPGNVYGEVNLSANHLRNLTRDLLDTFGIEHSSLQIYLRQDRDAETPVKEE